MAFVPSWLKRPQARIEARLRPAAVRWHGRGLRAAHLSLLQVPLAALTAVLILAGRLPWAFAALLAALLLDVADGLYARATGTADPAGHRLDKAMDLVGIYAFLAAVAWVRPDLWPPVALAATATAVLYGLGWRYDPEYIPGVRAAGLVWLLFPDRAVLLWLPGVVGWALAPALWIQRRPKAVRAEGAGKARAERSGAGGSERTGADRPVEK